MSNDKLSVLQKATRADVRVDPFPFLILEDALPSNLYDRLAETFPAAEALGIDTSKNNTRWNYSAHEVLKNRELPAIWRDFVAYHTSDQFFQEIVSLFQPEISALYPERFPNATSLRRMKAGVRRRDRYADVSMDAQIAGNTAVTEASSVRSTHVDQGNKLFSGLFYMRPAEYSAIGGDLTISRFASTLAQRPERLNHFQYAYVDDQFVDHVETIRYGKNVVVLFINSLDSLHGVTVRQPTKQSRLFVNLVGEVTPALYKLQESGDGQPFYTTRPSREVPFSNVVREVAGLFSKR